MAACLDNVAAHVGEDAPAWVLLEELPDRVEVTVRDEGPGIPEGRLAQAEREGRLGVIGSIRGRMADLGGTATLATGSFGTEWELSVPRTRARRTLASVTIHDAHPFLDPDPDPVRRLRGPPRRRGHPVDDRRGRGAGRPDGVLADGGERGAGAAAGAGRPGLRPRGVAGSAGGRAAVTLLAWEHRDLAEAFAGTAPAPGGLVPAGGVRADRLGSGARRPPHLGGRGAGGRPRGRLVVLADLPHRAGRRSATTTSRWCTAGDGTCGRVRPRPGVVSSSDGCQGLHA